MPKAINKDYLPARLALHHGRLQRLKLESRSKAPLTMQTMPWTPAKASGSRMVTVSPPEVVHGILLVLADRINKAEDAELVQTLARARPDSQRTRCDLN